MTTPYTGVPGNVSLAAAVQANVPVDGDTDSAATFTVGTQKALDYVEALRIMLAGAPFSEGFESATFPPVATSKWATPSSRYGADSVWTRATVNTIAGAGSASAPTPQALSTNSSLGLDVFLASPSRMSFLFSVNCNQNNGDHLDFFVDGVLTAQFSTQVSNTLVGGRFVTDMLREGLHTFDWRFVRGASASVASEECKLDTVEIISDEVWRGDPATRLYCFDEGFVNVTTATAIPGNQRVNPPWYITTGANAGTYGTGAIGGTNKLGCLGLATANTAAADFASAILQMGEGLTMMTPARTPFVEASVALNGNTANKILEVGCMDGLAAASGDFIGWAWDGSIGAASTWRWRGIATGTATSVDSNVAASGTAFVRLGVMTATVRGVTSAVFTKDGKALPGAASVPPLMVTGLPASGGGNPGFRVRSVTAAALVQADLDWIRAISLR